ncbi:PEP-CTERM sorting domain-containing protein [Aeoliella sp. ICT_H6.2]|uniref:PEP-CTERM sorting domain-containing protein n=1 Tax=Aeoliella straminimaris TaxID=2954799 RepID=A0A9X2FBM0_9BACT|nr:PEP-CTERM sorting domain-containing protein [Aeoliella straminimaris]MCO6045112.1 PEP-CTERM sorting domain-containing protein [Aeoliella straminimaris]
MRMAILSAAVLLCHAGKMPSATAHTFVGLGDLPGGSFVSEAQNLSADGRFVTGRSVMAGMYTNEAFLWSAETGMLGLGAPLGGDNSRGFAVSNDGNTVVGTFDHPSILYPQVFRWNRRGGITWFNPFPVDANDRPAHRNVRDMSADGNVVVGQYRNSLLALVGYQWSNDDLTEVEFGFASAVSADGSVVVGQAELPTTILEAFRWTVEDEVNGLGFLSGGEMQSEAMGVSANGQVIVGRSGSSIGTQAFRWTEEDGMVGLGGLSGGTFSIAEDANFNGSIIVGRAGSSTFFDPFIWDETHGMRNLESLLRDEYGLADVLAGWDLQVATAISDNGRVIIGNGINPDGYVEAWRVELVPEPSSLALGALALAAFACRQRFR